MPYTDLAESLRAHFEAADYTLDAVLDRLGEAGQAGLVRNQTMPARGVLGADADPQATLIRLFPLQQPVAADAAARALPVPELVRPGLLESAGDQVRAAIDIRPYGFEDAQGDWSGWVASDLMPGLDGQTTPTRPDYVLGISPASTTLAQLTIPDRVGRALDLGTGCGVQALHLARHADRIVATDLNPRALDLARLTAALNRVEVGFARGDLYAPVADQLFDLIVTNPPYVISPPTASEATLTYRETNRPSDGLVEQVVRDGVARLAPGGTLQVLANWVSDDWRDRLPSWVDGTDADLWVIERERLDVHSYIELWLTDAGLAGSPGWDDAYRNWLDYFAAQSITGVSMGWITLVRAGRPTPLISTEIWPHAVAQPVGPAISAQRAADTLANLPDAELLATALRLAEGIVQETFGEPGAADPAHIVLRSHFGLCRAIEVDTALGGVLGACDGELSLGVLIAAVAGLLGADEAELVLRLLPGVRDAIRDGIVIA